MIKKTLSILIIFSTQSPQSNCCQCCQSCRCSNQNNANLPNEEELRFDDRDIYYYLKRDWPKECRQLTQEDINKIAENYLRIINEADDTVKTLNEVATDIITPEIIKQYLGINEAINEINKLSSVREKIIRINWIVNDEYIKKKYTYENSTLKVPRCLVEHEDNNCVLESYLTAMLDNPYIVKLLYLLNYLFEKGFLSKENYPVTFEVCKFFYEAVNHPNFTNTIRCISIMKAYFDNYSDSNYAQQKYKNGEYPTYGSFQNNTFINEILESIKNELNINQNLQFIDDNSLLRFYSDNHWCEDLEDNIECLCRNRMDNEGINNLDYSGYKCKDNFIHFTAIQFIAVEFHFYTFRKINNIWISYDSYKVKTPTPISDKFVSRLILNSLLSINNFNGHYSGYHTTIWRHYDLLDGHPEGKLNDKNINIGADEGYKYLYVESSSEC